MDNNKLQKLAKEQVSVLSYTDDNEIAAINGFQLGFNYVTTLLMDILSSPEFASVIDLNIKEVDKTNLDALKEELRKRTDMTFKQIELYSGFLSKFFRSYYKAGVDLSLKAVKKAIEL